MRKSAFYDVVVAKNKRKDSDTTKGYLKEHLNMGSGALVGGAAGATVGAIGGAMAGLGNPLTAAGGALVGGAIGSAAGAYKSLRATERGAGQKESSKGKYFGRVSAGIGLGTAGALTGSIAAHSLGIDRKKGALVGGAAGALLGDLAVRNSGR